MWNGDQLLLGDHTESKNRYIAIFISNIHTAMNDD